MLKIILNVFQNNREELKKETQEICGKLSEILLINKI